MDTRLESMAELKFVSMDSGVRCVAMSLLGPLGGPCNMQATGI